MPRRQEFIEAEVIQKAMEVFWKKGYAATTTRDLTEAMQINISSLYNSIGDKHQLFIRCIRHYSEVRIRAAESRIAHYKSPFRALEAFIKDAAKTIITEQSSCLCIKAAFEIEGDDPEVNQAVNAYNDYVHEFMKSMVIKAQDSGEIAATENPDTIADYLDSLFTGWYNSFILHRDQKRIQQMAAYAIRHLKV